MNKPIRVQLSRKKGWRMPPNTVKVSRPGKWGNPWKPAQYWDAGYTGSLAVALQHCVDAHREWMIGKTHWAHGSDLRPRPDVSELRGKNLACWCKLYGENGLRVPCHADILLSMANGIPLEKICEPLTTQNSPSANAAFVKR